MQVNSQTEKQVTKNATECQKSMPRFLIYLHAQLIFTCFHQDGSTKDDSMATV